MKSVIEATALFLIGIVVIAFGMFVGEWLVDSFGRDTAVLVTICWLFWFVCLGVIQLRNMKATHKPQSDQKATGEGA